MKSLALGQEMRMVAIIQARMGSKRLPGKVLMDLGGHTVLSRVVRRLRRAKLVNEIVIGTTNVAADDAIVLEGERLGVPSFRGSEEDVLDRHYRAAQEAEAGAVVRITSDCPLIDPGLVDDTIKVFHDKRPDYASNVSVRTYPRGLDSEVFTMAALEQAWRDAREPHQREHVTPYLYEHPELFRLASIRGQPDYSSYRWTLDTAADLRLLREIYARFGNQDTFGWREVIALMEAEPSLAQLNLHVIQKSILGLSPNHGTSSVRLRASQTGKRQMKALVVGGGSIGKCHLQNLRELGVEDIALVEADAQRRRTLSGELGVPGFSHLNEGLDWTPAFAVVATPTHLHVEQALQIARNGFDLFVEKPLGHTASGLHELLEVVEQKQLISMVGCNMRFHPGPARVKELLLQHRLGKILFARLHVGSYLPSWRPEADYRVNYAAADETGGGCILDCIHEIDLARWYLGEVSEVFCMAGHMSSLAISTEDVAILVCRHIDGPLSEIHLDYVQRTYERGCQIVGESGSIFWDFNQRQVRWFDATTTQWAFFDEPQEWQFNRMYVDEMRHFLSCVRNRDQTVLPISEAVADMQIVFAAKESSRQRALVSTEREVPA